LILLGKSNKKMRMSNNSQLKNQTDPAL